MTQTNDALAKKRFFAITAMRLKTAVECRRWGISRR